MALPRQPFHGNGAKGFAIVDISAADHTFSRPVRAIAFGTAGALALVTPDGTDLIIPSGVLAAGVMHPLGVVTVKKTGTTATNIVGFF